MVAFALRVFVGWRTPCVQSIMVTENGLLGVNLQVFLGLCCREGGKGFCLNVGLSTRLLSLVVMRHYGVRKLRVNTTWPDQKKITC